MRLATLIILFFLPVFTFAHKGNFVSIENVKINNINTKIFYSFELENIKGIALEEITIELVVNGISIDTINIARINPISNRISYQFEISTINLARDFVQIEITKLFGVKNDWGGWDAPQDKQVNVPGTYEVFADVPWRMDRFDAQGNENEIPVHCFIHGADGIFFASLEYIDISIKNASDTSFGTPITFATYAQQDYTNLFSVKSVFDTVIDVQKFDLTTSLKDSLHTISFIKDTSFLGAVRTIVDHNYWYFTIHVPASAIANFNDAIDVKVDFSLNNVLDAQTGLRIFRNSSNSIPKITDYYRGDTHLHSLYTQNSAEVGSPLEATKEAAKLIGLDWITTTDHTSDFDNYGQSVASNWERLGGEVATLNALDTSLIYIRGQEVALNNSNTDLVHFLAYPSSSSPSSPSFLGDGNGDLVSTNITINSALDSLATYNGFAYAAHPFATADKLPTVPVGGGIWNLNDSLFPQNGSNYPLTGGNIISNDYSVPSDIYSSKTNEFIKNALKGSQIWNDRNSLMTTTNNENPWDISYTNADPFIAIDTTKESQHFVRFKQGQEILNHINIRGLKEKNNNVNMKNWKMYYSAGSDAHGSFNFSNTNDFLAIGNISNNAVGRLTTLAFCPSGMGSNGEHLLEAMYRGNTSISDGPVIIQGITTNGDDNNFEILMGDDAVISENDFNTSTYFVINYATTPEFGDVNYLKVCVGTENGEICKKISFTSNGNITQSFLLKNLIEMILGQGNTPQNKYFYIRSQIETTIDYLLEGTAVLHRMDKEYYHAFSNPIWIKKDINTAISSPDLEKIKILPNPFTNKFTIQFGDNKKTKNITVTNSLGQVVYQKNNYNESSIVVDEKLPIGMYLVTVSTKNSSRIFKLIKEN